MGIRGLTTFINNRSHLYLKDHELHDCKVIIDGNSLASTLYKWHCRSNDCFGGDYDKFAQVIRNFFDLLSQCNVTPYVILDGGYEKRKLNTVISRMKNKIRAAEALNAVTEDSESVFPLFLREVFVDMVVTLGVKVVRCEFEGDMEIASIARNLECPVISYDSDFYIFGCLYIPFPTVELTARKGKDKVSKTTYMYLSCKIYHIENFLQAFGGLDKGNLPLLAVILGNDYVKGKIFRPFFKNLKIQKCSGNQSDQQKRIKSVIVWLQNENMESAIKNILSRFKSVRRQSVLKKIQVAMKGYFEVSSELLKHLDIELPVQHDNIHFDFEKLSISAEDDCESDSQSSDDNNSSQNELEVDEDILTELDTDYVEESIITSELFKRKYRNCQYPACFMDMITMNRYYCVPQVEDSSSEHSHTISLDILKTIHKILTPHLQKGLKIVCRSGKGRIKYVNLPRPEVDVPTTLESIEKMGSEQCKLLLLNLLSIDNRFSQILNSFTIEWHLFLISLKYAFGRGQFDSPLLYSSLMCFIILNYVDTKIGFYRVSKTFDKKFAQMLLTIKANNAPSCFTGFDNLLFEDCLVFMDKMITFFQMDSKLKINYRLYDKVLVHTLSQIQSVFLHVKYLNSLLNNPFPVLVIHKIFDGTFLYNMAINLRKRSSINEYLDLFLKDCQAVLDGVKTVVSMLDDCFEFSSVVGHKVKRHRKKKRKNVETKSEEDVMDVYREDETDVILDPNNPYSILAVI